MNAVKNHFVITINSAKCNHFIQSLKNSSGNTKGLWYHLEARHPKIFEKIKDAKKTIVKPPKSNEKPPSPSTQGSCSDSKDEAQARLVNFVVRNNLPFSIVDDPDLVYLFKEKDVP